MAGGILLAHTEPASAEALDEFNRWYDEVHIPEVLEKIPGVVGARRFELAPEQLMPAEALPARRFLAVYDIEDAELAQVAADLGAGLSDGTLTLSSALDPGKAPLMVFYAAR